MTRGSPPSDGPSYSKRTVPLSPSAPPASPSSSPPPAPPPPPYLPSLPSIPLQNQTVPSTMRPANNTPPPLMSPVKFEGNQSTSAVVGEAEEGDGLQFLSVASLDRLDEQLNRPRWVVPVLPKQELEILMETCIKLIKAGQESNDPNFARFLDNGLKVSFTRLMTDEAVKDWKAEIQRYIFRAADRFLNLFTAKLERFEEEPIPDVLWMIFALVLDHRCRFHSHNMHRQPEFFKPPLLNQGGTDRNDNETTTTTTVRTEDGIRVADGVSEVVQVAPLPDHSAPAPAAPAVPLQHSPPIVVPNSLRYFAVESKQYGWLADLINRFGERGGFDALKRFLDASLPEATLAQLSLWLRPLGGCALMLRKETISDFALDAIKALADKLKLVKDEDLKCELVKADLQENPCLESSKIVRHLLANQPSQVDIVHSMEYFRLRFILRVLQVAPFAGRIQALDEIYGILTSRLSIYSVSADAISLDDERLIDWLREHELIDVLLKDNLHQPVFVERLEKVLRALQTKQAIRPRDLDKVWLAQTGKHDVIQRNLHDLFARLTNDLNSEQLEQLFERFKESWRSANVRERTLLLDLIRRLGVDANESGLIDKTLSLLWDLAREPDMPPEQMEQALNSMFKILEAPRRNSFRQTYVKKCIDELRNNTNFVVPALKHMQRIFILAPEAPNNYHISAQQRSMYRHDIISEIQSHEQLCRMLTQNLTTYMEKLREAQTTHPLPPTADPGDFMLDGRTLHRDQLRARLEFLQFVLREGRLWLMMEQAIDLWDSLVVNAVFSYDRNTGFNMFASMQQNDDVDPDSLVQFFETKVLHLEPQLLNDAGLDCFESFFKAVNTKENRLISVRIGQYFLNSTDLKGQDYLWQIILSASEKVSNKAIELFRDIYSSPAADISGHLNELNARIIEESIERLKHMYDAILVEPAESPAIVEQQKLCATKMTRIIKALCAYVRAYDDEFLSVERKRCPLHRASLGRCFRLRVRIPVSSFTNATHRPMVGPLNQNVVSSPLAVQDEIVEVLVHSHQSLDRLRREVLLRWQMAVNVAPPPKLDLFDGPRLLDSSDDRKTLVECAITEMSNMTLKLSNAATTTSSPESSIESTPADRSPSNELNAPLEQLLPGVAIANLADGTDFLFKVADLGARLNRTDLRDNARFLLQLIPADQKVVSELRAAAERHEMSTLFFAESPTKVLYYLEVAHSLLMPAQTAQECNEFQELFYRANGLRTCLEMLSGETFMAGADVHTRNLANQWMLRMLKFNLAVAGHLSVDHLLRTTRDENERLAANIHRGILEAVPGYHEHLFRQLCEQMALRLRDVGLSGELLQFKAKRTELEKLLRLAWTAGSGSTAHTVDTPLDAISASYDQQLARDATLEQISLSAMDALTLAFVACVEANELFEQEMWPRFVVDILFSKMLSVRNQAVESIYVILSKICIGPRKSTALSTAIALLFDNVEKTETRAEIAGSYFHLLCRLLEFSRAQRIEVPLILERLEAQFDWLDKAKQECIANMESYPVDNLLSGHFDVAKDLIEFLSPEQKYHFGAAPNGRQLVKTLLDEFLLPSSRAFVELGRQSQQSAGNIQRSVTMAASISHSAAGTSNSSTMPPFHPDRPESSTAPVESMDTSDNSPLTSGSIPRSATTCISPTRCVPVCGSPESVSAAYDTLVALSSDCVENMRAVVGILVEMFYKQLDQSSVEWEFAPVVALRGAGSYVGLKNGGATCYMNSVFQQLFMVESVRHALLNAPGTQADFEGDSDDEVLPLSKMAVAPPSRKDYNMSIMRCVQMIFANLLGSQLQFYIPRRFWRRFRFAEQPVNLREQQDALEFFNSVVESVDEGLKSLGESPACERVFGGLFADQKICKGCPHRYQRDEPFTSLSVDIRSHNNLLDSLKEYVKGDLLDNDNAYLCERCNKKVAAIKRLCISKLPSCLTIQLKRFDFDWEHEVPVKFNDCFEFPLELDMEPYTVRGLAKQEGESITEEETGEMLDATMATGDDGSSLYRLRGVVVHSGQANGGHYYAFIRSDRGDGKWYKFDDTDVHEHDLSTEDDMRNAWFGGEYITDMFDHITKRYTPRRQKRWWNAYLLFYERITPAQPAAPSSSTTVALGNQMESMSLSSKLRLMLPELEAVVRGKNTRVLHERNEYTPEYFQFIRQLTTTIIASQYLKNPAIPEQQRKEMALLTMQLLGKFLFTTGLHAKRSLRGNMQDWLNNMIALFAFSAESRLWFVDSILYSPSRTFSLYLFESTSTEVRHFFVRLLVVLMEKSRDDPSDQISQLRHSGESVSDVLVRTLLTLPMTNTNDFHRHPCQYFALFYHYASLGPVEKQQLLRHGVLLQMLKIVLEEHQLTRGMYAEMAKCYQTIGLLIRCCDVSEYCLSAIDGEAVRPNPFAVSKEPAAKMPEEVGKRLFSPGGVERFCRTMLDQSTAGYDVTRSLLQFLCWENMAFTRSAFRSFNWESLFSWNDIKQYLKVLESLLEMQDSWQKERILFGLRGDGVDKPKPMGILKLMRSNFGFSAKKCYSMLKMITMFLESSSAAQEVLEQNADVREEYVNVAAWLKLELDAAQRHEETYGATSNYGHQAPPSNEAPGVGNSGLERSDSAIDLLAACRRVCKKATGKDRPDRADERRVDAEMHPTRMPSSGGGGGGGAADDSEDDDDEDDDDDREGPFASLSMEEHRGGPADVLPPPYTDHSTTSFSFTGPGSRRMRHSQSASSGLDSGSATDLQSTDTKIPLSRTTDGGFHLTLSTTAPARTTAADPTLPFTSPKSMETRDDLTRTAPGGEL